MKQYIKSFLLFALVCVGLVSCNEQDMPDNVTYPDHAPLQTWKSSTPTQIGIDYYISNFVNAMGDTVCNVIMVDPETKQPAMFAANGRSEYDKVSGMSLNNFASCLVDGLPAEFAVALRRDLTTANVHFSVAVGPNTYPQDYFRAAPQKGYPIQGFYFGSLDPEAPVQVTMLFMDESNFMTYVGTQIYAGTYEWNEVAGQGVLHTSVADDSGTPLPDAEVKDQSLYINQLGQMVLRFDGVDYPIQIIEM